MPIDGDRLEDEEPTDEFEPLRPWDPPVKSDADGGLSGGSGSGCDGRRCGSHLLDDEAFEAVDALLVWAKGFGIEKDEVDEAGMGGGVEQTWEPSSTIGIAT